MRYGGGHAPPTVRGGLGRLTVVHVAGTWRLQSQEPQGVASPASAAQAVPSEAVCQGLLSIPAARFPRWTHSLMSR